MTVALYRPMLMYAVTMVIMALVMMSGCAQLGMVSAPTLEHCNAKVGAAILTIAEARTTAAYLLSANKIQLDDAQNVLAQTDHARAGAEIASSMCLVNTTTADKKIDSVTAIVRGVTNYLNSFPVEKK